MNPDLVVLLATLLQLAFAGSRSTLSLFVISLNASPFTVGFIMSPLAALPMLFSAHAGRAIDRMGVALGMAARKKKRPATALARDGRPQEEQ
jgi:hypothetical protein